MYWLKTLGKQKSLQSVYIYVDVQLSTYGIKAIVVVLKDKRFELLDGRILRTSGFEGTEAI